MLIRIPIWTGFAIVLMASCDATARSRPSACAPIASAAGDVVKTLREAYTAMHDDDRAAWDRSTTPDFYAFDGGVKLDRQQLFEFVKAARADGKLYTWNVTEPDPHMECDWAWIAYVNRGSIRDAQGEITSIAWLESAVLRYNTRRWRIAFLHSTRIRAQS